VYIDTGPHLPVGPSPPVNIEQSKKRNFNTGKESFEGMPFTFFVPFILPFNLLRTDAKRQKVGVQKAFEKGKRKVQVSRSMKRNENGKRANNPKQKSYQIDEKLQKEADLDDSSELSVEKAQETDSKDELASSPIKQVRYHSLLFQCY
jgi:hypothetical protein